MKYCNKCGSEIPEGMTSCPKCSEIEASQQNAGMERWEEGCLKAGIVIILVFVGIAFLLSKMGPSGDSDGGSSSNSSNTVATATPTPSVATDSTIIDCAKSLISNNLKNPASAVWNNAYIMERDDYGRYIVEVDVSGQNGFGGYTRNVFYVFLTKVTPDGRYTYRQVYPFTDKKAYIDIYKNGIDWGKPEETEENKG